MLFTLSLERGEFEREGLDLNFSVLPWSWVQLSGGKAYKIPTLPLFFFSSFVKRNCMFCNLNFF